MATFHLNITFSGIDFDDDDTFEALAELTDILWRSQGQIAYGIATVEATSIEAASVLLTQKVKKCVPSASLISFSPDL